MVAISMSGSGEGPGRDTGRGYSTIISLIPAALHCTALRAMHALHATTQRCNDLALHRIACACNARIACNDATMQRRGFFHELEQPRFLPDPKEPAVQLTVRDVGRYLNVAEATVTRWVKQRGLPAQYVGGQYRFNRAELL